MQIAALTPLIPFFTLSTGVEGVRGLGSGSKAQLSLNVGFTSLFLKELVELLFVLARAN